MNGVLVIDKPAGPTSHDVVACVRRATGWAKVGHTGTLDPMATGVLPLVVGRATRLAQFLSATDKVYEAEVRLGWATDTYDAEGTRIESNPAEAGSPGVEVPGPADALDSISVRTGASAPARTDWPAADDLDRILDHFRGSYVQVAPPFSAKKIDGVRAYSLAREGRPIEPKGSPVTVHEVSCIARDGDRLRLRIRCSAGFYVRSFAHELGVSLGVGAHLSALRRTKSGDFEAADAVPLELVEREGQAAVARLVPIDRLLASMPAVVVTEEGAARTRHGNDLRPEDLISRPDALPGRVRVVDEQGVLLAIGAPSGKPGLLHPGIVVV
jgi:tRNA pseudouridine55 synthase